MERNVSTLLLTSPMASAPIGLLGQMLPVLSERRALVEEFVRRPITPAAEFDFENRLQTQLRELGRRVVQWVFAHLEPNDRADMPRQLRFHNECYRRRGKSPRRSPVATLFGPVQLERFVDRPWTPGEAPIRLGHRIQPTRVIIAIRRLALQFVVNAHQPPGRIEGIHAVAHLFF